MNLQDVSVGKDAYHQIWQIEFNPGNPHGRRKEQLPQLSSDFHTHIYMCVHTQIILNIVEKKNMKKESIKRQYPLQGQHHLHI